MHGAQDTGFAFRKRTGYEFDKIAEHEDLIVIYPDGFKKSWNDCRKHAKYPSKVKRIDDFEFLKKIKKQITYDQNVEVKNTFMVGFSNGGQLVNRICLEYPEWIDAACVIAANLPVHENLECKPKNIAVPIVYFCGTNDKTNPYNGGLVNVLGIKKLGYISSSEETIKYWCSLSDYKFIISDFIVPQEEKTSIEKKIWENSEGSILVQFVVHGGGHTIPNMDMNFPRILGLTNHDMNSYQEIWDFFKEQINISANSQLD